MVARWVRVGVLKRYRFRRTLVTSDADTRQRPLTCARRSRHAKIDASAVAGGRVLRFTRTRGSPGCSFDAPPIGASLKCVSPNIPFV